MLLNWSTFSFTKNSLQKTSGMDRYIDVYVRNQKISRQQKNNQIYLYYDGWFASEVCDVVAAFKKHKNAKAKKTPLHVFFIFFYYQNQINSFRLPPRMRFCFLNVFYMFSSSFLLYGLVFHTKNGRTKRKKNIKKKTEQQQQQQQKFSSSSSSTFRLRLLLLSFRTSQSAVFAAPVYVYSTLS